MCFNIFFSNFVVSQITLNQLVHLLQSKMVLFSCLGCLAIPRAFISLSFSHLFDEMANADCQLGCTEKRLEDQHSTPMARLEDWTMGALT
jgi:hypothetical protein